MNKLHKRRIQLIIFFSVSFTLAISLILWSLKENLNVFFTPVDLGARNLREREHLRLGGLVRVHSVKRDNEHLTVQFIVTDFKADIVVSYKGILPDLFREGKGVIVEGKFSPDGLFLANQVLAKHDENYTPKKIALVLKENKARAEHS